MQAPKKTTTIRETLRAKAALSIEPQPPVALDRASVEAGRKPLATRRPGSVDLKAKALELYGMPPNGLAAITPIESGFKFSPAESDGELYYLHVESLLAEALRLLEQCATYRSQRDLLQIEKWKFQVELDKFFRLDQIQEREREAGLDTLPYERTLIESAAERSLEENHRSAEAQLKSLLEEMISSGFNKRMAARELTAWLSSYPLKDRELSGDDASYTFDGARKTKPEHLFDAARIEADEDAWERLYSLLSQRYSSMAASEAGRMRKESLDLEAKFAQAGIAFRREKAQAERDAVLEKIFQAQAPGSPLNFAERLTQVERRFSIDFRDTLARLTAAQRGLKELFDYAPPFPPESAPGYFDEVMLWAKKASTRVSQFSRLDQSYILAVSVKELAKGQWDQGRSSSEWTFDIPEDLFKGQSYVRLLGLSVAVVAPKQDELEPPPTQKTSSQKGGAPKPEAAPRFDGFWSARISLPPAGIIRTAADAHELDQKSLPSCYLGRVTDRNSPHAGEIAGADILRNASPIGKQWKLALSPKSTDGASSDKLQDVQLYLHVVVWAKA